MVAQVACRQAANYSGFVCTAAGAVQFRGVFVMRQCRESRASVAFLAALAISDTMGFARPSFAVPGQPPNASNTQTGPEIIGSPPSDQDRSVQQCLHARIADLSRQIAEQPGAELFVERGEAWIALQQPEVARADADAALRYDRRNFAAFHLRAHAEARIACQTHDRAVAALEDLLARGRQPASDNPDQQEALGKKWKRLDALLSEADRQYGRAIRDASEAIRLAPPTACGRAVLYATRAAIWHDRADLSRQWENLETRRTSVGSSRFRSLSPLKADIDACLNRSLESLVKVQQLVPGFNYAGRCVERAVAAIRAEIAAVDVR